MYNSFKCYNSKHLMTFNWVENALTIDLKLNIIRKYTHSDFRALVQCIYDDMTAPGHFIFSLEMQQSLCWFKGSWNMLEVLVKTSVYFVWEVNLNPSVLSFSLEMRRMFCNPLWTLRVSRNLASLNSLFHVHKMNSLSKAQIGECTELI